MVDVFMEKQICFCFTHYQNLYRIHCDYDYVLYLIYKLKKMNEIIKQNYFKYEIEKIYIEMIKYL